MVQIFKVMLDNVAVFVVKKRHSHCWVPQGEQVTACTGLQPLAMCAEYLYTHTHTSSVQGSSRVRVPADHDGMRGLEADSPRTHETQHVTKTAQKLCPVGWNTVLAKSFQTDHLDVFVGTHTKTKFAINTNTMSNLSSVTLW